ncbi:MAG: IS630 transposase-related protein [Defluviitaleaceae bacterium]|nr:IS630 transposase-related protein [Defluviitaleaceae bacterium]
MKYISKGHTHKEASRNLGVSKSSIIRWSKLLRETGSLADMERQRTPHKIQDADLKAFVAANPDAYFTEIAAHFGCSDEGIRKACKRLGITRKKKTKFYKVKCEAKKSVNTFLKKSRTFPPNDLVYIDESDATEYYTHAYGLAPRGEKVYGEVSGKRYKRTNVVSTLYGNETIATYVCDWATKSVWFEVWFEWHLPYGNSPSYYVGSPEDATAVWEPEFSLGQLYNNSFFLLGYYGEVNEFCNAILENLNVSKGHLDDGIIITKIFRAFAEGANKQTDIS